MSEREHTRVRSGLRLDREGRFWHDGARIEHEGIQRAFTAGLARALDGRYFVRLGGDWAYVTVEDAPWQILRVELAGEQLLVRLSDGTEEFLDPSTLGRSAEGVLYALVKRGENARLSRQAQADLTPFLEEAGERYVLVVAQRRAVIAEGASGPPPGPDDGPPPGPDDGPPPGRDEGPGGAHR